MSEYERLMARAEQAERLARGVTTRDHRDKLLSIAKDWRDMAERAARAEGRSIPKPDRSDRDPDA